MKTPLFLLVVSLLIIGCQAELTFNNHPRPDLTADFSPFEDAGCPQNEYGARYCEEDSPLLAFGCDEISETSDLFGGLTPNYPITYCYVEPLLSGEDLPDEPEFPDEGTYFYSSGGFFPRFTRYVIYKDGEFELLQNLDDFRAVFAPVDTPEEALGYALAVNRASAYFDLEHDPQYEYFVDTIEDTHVETRSDGYLVHLFRYQFFGCGPHNTYALTFHVSEQGEIEEVSSEPIFKDPSEDDLCVD